MLELLFKKVAGCWTAKKEKIRYRYISVDFPKYFGIFLYKAPAGE